MVKNLEIFLSRYIGKEAPEMENENERKPNGYWQSLENTIQEAKQAMEENGWETLPGEKNLRKSGYAGLPSAITKYHGGMQKFRRLMGENDIDIRKPAQYWQSEENIINEAEQAMEEEGWKTLPGEKILRKKGYAIIAASANTYHGGLPNLRKLLGQNNKERKKGYWQSLENTIKETEQAMEKEGWETLPGAWTLGKFGYSSLSDAISKYHGGIQNFRELLGQKNKNKQHGYWESLENTMREAQEAMEKEGWETLPSQRELYQNGYSSLNYAITAYHGGIQTFREMLGQENSRKKKGYWESPKNAIKEAQTAMAEQEWETLPGIKVLQKSGYSSLVHAIQRYYNGLHAFRELLRTHLNQPSESEQIESLLETYVNGGNNDE